MSSTINPRAVLKKFRVVNAALENRIAGLGKTRLTLLFTPAINFLLVPATSPSEHSNMLVTIIMEGEAKPEGDNGETIAHFRTTYEARFEYAKDVEELAIKKAMEDVNYQFELTSQAYPLSVNSFKQTLASMGFEDLSLPLSALALTAGGTN